MSIEKITEATLETPPQEPLPWLESDTWDESSMWQTDFQAESLWENDSIENEDIQSNTLLEQLSSSESQLVKSSKDHIFEESQLVEIVEGEILLADPLNENPLDEPKESFETSEPISLQEMYKEVKVESNDKLLDNFPADSDSSLEKSLHVENLPELENLNYEENKNPSEGSLSEEIEDSTKQITPLNTNTSDLDIPQETGIQTSVEQSTPLSTSHSKLNPDLFSSADKNKADLDASQVAKTETQPSVEHSTPLNTTLSDLDPDHSSVNKNNGEAIAINIPIHLVPIVRELINLFEQHPTTKVQNSTFKNKFKHKEAALQKQKFL